MGVQGSSCTRQPLTCLPWPLQVVLHNRPGGIVQDRINLFMMQFLTPELQEDKPSYQFSGGKLAYNINGGLAGGLPEQQARHCAGDLA